MRPAAQQPIAALSARANIARSGVTALLSPSCAHNVQRTIRQLRRDLHRRPILVQFPSFRKRPTGSRQRGGAAVDRFRRVRTRKSLTFGLHPIGAMGYPTPKTTKGDLTMSRALDIFVKQQTHVEQLIEVHEANNQRQPSARRDYSGLNHAGVVFCVAHWQAYATNVVEEVYDEVDSLIKNPDGNIASWNKSVFELNKVSQKRKRLNTPNSRNVINFFKDTLEFDPTKKWNVTERIDRKWDVKEHSISDRIDFWLSVRHAVAHGFELPMDIRSKFAKDRKFNLTYHSFLECRDFFNFLVITTEEDLIFYVRDKFDITLKGS